MGKKSEETNEQKTEQKTEPKAKEDPEQPSTRATEISKGSQKWSQLYENSSGKMINLMEKQANRIEEIAKKDKKKKDKVKGGKIKKFKLGKM